MTPGPWRICGDMTHIGNKRIATMGFSAIAKVYADEPVRDDAKATANAKAIAAVPDMVAALKEARDELVRLRDRYGSAHSEIVISHAETALQKAGQL